MNNDEQMFQCEAEGMALPPLRLAQSVSPFLEAKVLARSEWRVTPEHEQMELAVKRTIAFLLKEK